MTTTSRRSIETEPKDHVMKLFHSLSALAAASLLAACASAPAPRAVPAAIATAPHQPLAMSVAARGVQIYECRATQVAGADAREARHEWAFVAPRPSCSTATATWSGATVPGRSGRSRTARASPAA